MRIAVGLAVERERRGVDLLPGPDRLAARLVEPREVLGLPLELAGGVDLDRELVRQQVELDLAPLFADEARVGPT